MSEPAALLDPTPGPPAETLPERAARILAGNIRPGDYLPVPEALRAQTEREIGLAQGMRPGVRMAEAKKHRVHQDRVLEHHHGGAVVATLRTPDGVVVLAVGEDEIGELLDRVPTERKGVAIEFPEPW